MYDRSLNGDPNIEIADFVIWTFFYSGLTDILGNWKDVYWFFNPDEVMEWIYLFIPDKFICVYCINE